MRRAHRFPFTVFVALALGAVVASSSPAVAGSPYGLSTYGYGLHRDGYDAAETALGTGNASGLHQLWSAAVGGVVTSQPLVVPDVHVGGGTATLVVVGSANGYVYALKAGTGALIWKRFLGVQRTGCS